MLELGYAAFGFVAAHLLVQSVEKLLAGGGACERSAIVKRTAKATEIEQALGRPVESNAHTVQQVDDGRRGVTHGLYRRLIGQEVAAIDGVVKMLPRGVAFTLEVLGRVDAALRAYGMRSLDRHDGKQIHVSAGFSNLDDGRQTREPAAYYDNFRSRCHKP